MEGTARRLIIKYGTPIRLYKAKTEGMFERGTHREYWIVNDEKTYVPPDDLAYDGFATVHKPKHYEITDGRIRSTDVVFRCVDIPKPDEKDTLYWRGDTYTIIFVQPIIVQNNEIVHVVFARIA